jgi:hypothetical protein
MSNQFYYFLYGGMGVGGRKVVYVPQNSFLYLYRICGFLGCCAVYCGGWIPMFERNMLPPSSTYKILSSLKFRFYLY